MWPTIAKIGPITLHSYGLMIAIGFLLALYCAQRDFGKNGLDPQIATNHAFWALFLGVVGTRVLHIIMFPESYSWRDPIGWIAIWRGGLVFQGALIGPVIYCWIVFKRLRIDFWKVVDLSVPYVPLAHAVGRIGCVLNGCCYGARTDLPWGIRFPRVPWDLSLPPTGSPAYLDHADRFAELSVSTDHWSYAVHPTQVYELVALLAIVGTLLLMRSKWNPCTGFTLPMYLILYGIVRFIIEFFRGDHNPRFWGVISDQQFISLMSLPIGLALFAYLIWRQNRLRTPPKKN